MIPGTIFRNTNLKNTRNVDPILERYIKDQEFLYVFKYKSKINKIIYRFWWVTSNCGRSLLLWAAWCFLISLLFGFLYMIPLDGPSLHLNPHTPSHWFTYFYYSIVTFTTLGFGEITPQNVVAEVLVILEVIIGYVMLGGLISIFANKMARRS